ncbi:hypothetical protein BaRGS_00005644 [Batillaria attramentaria]|uniref:Uncharacterized protein n=1 Tax=Batillaria attramentaria TaxID=370345 RepID=A0ABD0LUE7_9CAEN
MGSFFGHALPGAMFFLFGAWWTVQTGQRFRSTATFPCFFCPGQRMRSLPMEAIVKISLCGVGIIVEFIGVTLREAILVLRREAIIVPQREAILHLWAEATIVPQREAIVLLRRKAAKVPKREAIIV